MSRSKLGLVLVIATALSTVQAARADLVITYNVEIVQSGPVPIGATIDWRITATVSEVNGGPSVGTNNGIAAAVIDLQDLTGDMLNPGTIQTASGQDFQGYQLSDGGFWNGVTLQNIGAFQFDPNAMTVGETGDLGPHLLAVGSYVVTTPGLHTLTTVLSASNSQYWSDLNQPATPTPFDQVLTGSDTIFVTPEPPSLALMGVVACGAWLTRRRRSRDDG